MTLVYIVHIQGDSDTTAPFPHNQLYIIIISSCSRNFSKLQLVTTYVGMGAVIVEINATVLLML